MHMAAAVESIPVAKLDGTPSSLGEYTGKVRLVVNVASKCGLTPQYEGLEKLYKSYKDKGLEVMGFPANNFGAQEPGTNAEIATFCSTNYGVTFPMFAKISVKGGDQHPLYKALIEAQPKATAKDNAFKDRLAGYGIKPDNETDVLWNFEKFLVGRDGKVIGRFSPDIAADDPMLVGAIDKAL
jgi:glutathione peroxidase